MDRAAYILDNARGKVLDVGYACGTLHSRLQERLGSENVYGIDTERKIEDSFHKIASAEEIPFKDAFFDCVVAGELIEHLERPEKFIGESARVLKKGGLLLITTPNRKSWVNRVLHSYETKVHPSLFEKGELERLLKEKGFAINKVEYFPYTQESSYGSRAKWSFALRKIIHNLLPSGMRENMAITAERV